MTTITNLNNLNKQLFTELTPTESAVIQGGAVDYYNNVAFNTVYDTSEFKVSAGGDVKLSSYLEGSPYYNSGFIAELQNQDGQKATRSVSIDNQTVDWNNLKGGRYTIQLRDADESPYPNNLVGRLEVRYN
jgi:hypothetical protein